MRDEFGEEVAAPTAPQPTAPKVTSRHISPAPRRAGTTALASLQEGDSRAADLT